MRRMWGTLWNRRSYYHKSLLLFIAATCLPALLIGVGIYEFGTRQIERDVRTNHQHHLQLALERINGDLSHLETNAGYWVFDSVFGAKLQTLEQTYDYEYIYEIFRTLFIVKGSDPLIEQVYLYLDKTGEVLTDDGGVAGLSAEDASVFRALLLRPERAYWTPSFTSGDEKRSSPSPALVYQLPITSSDKFAALVVQLNNAKFTKLIQELSPDELGVSFLIDDRGEPMKYGGLERQPSSIEDAIRQEVLRRNQETESFDLEWQGEKYYVSYGIFPHLGSNWKYVTAASLSRISEPVAMVSKTIVGISLLGLAISLVLSVFASWQLYRPIRRLTAMLRSDRSHVAAVEDRDEIAFIGRQLLQFKDQMDRQLPTLKQGFLIQLIQGHLQSLPEPELVERTQQFGWDIRNKRFAVVFIQIVGITNGNGRFREGEETLVSFAAANIADELAKTWTEQAETINFQDMSMGLLIPLPVDGTAEKDKEQLYRLAEELAAQLSRYLKLKVTVCIGTITDSLSQVPAVLEEARQTASYRDMSLDHQLLDVEDYMRHGEHPVYYPFALEHEIIHALRSGLPDESIRLIRQFCEELQTHSSKQFLFRQSILQLLGNIQYALLKSGFNPYGQAEGAPIYEQLLDCGDMPEVIRFFEHKVIQPFSKEFRQLANQQQTKAKNQIDQVIETLNASYADPISLESCADLHGINPFTLSKSFKQVTGENFIDYLTGIRLRKAKELLAGSDLKIHEIAEQVGYQPKYFNKLFKRHEGFSPSQYRENWTSKPTDR